MLGLLFFAMGWGGGKFGYTKASTSGSGYLWGRGVVRGDSGGPILDLNGHITSVISYIAPSRNIIWGNPQ